MIDFIQGKIVHRQLDSVTIDIHGLGYLVNVPSSVYQGEGESIKLYTQFIVREDAQTLYGFSAIEERSLFRLLLGVSGVGPKVGLGMIDKSNYKNLINFIGNEDIKSLVKLPGIGKKTAQRIVLDLKDKIVEYGFIVDNTLPEDINTMDNKGEVIGALMSLGYTESESNELVKNAINKAGGEVSTEECIKLALKSSVVKS